ncbi:MAG: hypothetical protein WCH46_02665 [bacterium]
MRVIIAGFLGAIVLFIWGFISWAVLPWNAQTMHTIPNEDSVLNMLKAQHLETGLYRIPNEMRKDEASRNAAYEKMKAGPIAIINYSNDGMDSGTYMLKGFIVLLLSAIMGALLLSKLSWALASKFSARVQYVMMLGVFIAVAGRFSDWAWFGTSTSFTIAVAIQDIIGWTLAGMVIAWRMKPTMTKKA